MVEKKSADKTDGMAELVSVLHDCAYLGAYLVYLIYSDYSSRILASRRVRAIRKSARQILDAGRCSQ
jgi:hypothetical protein